MKNTSQQGRVANATGDGRLFAVRDISMRPQAANISSRLNIWNGVGRC